MAKRFTDTEKWRDKWFRSLNPLEKLLFIYLVDNCDNAGVIEIDYSFWAYQVGCDNSEIIKAFNGLSKCTEVVGEWCWIENFLRHQKNLPLNETNNAHKQILSLLDEHKNRFISSIKFQYFLGANKGLNRPIGNSNDKVKVKVDENELIKNRYLIESQCRLHQCKEEEIIKHIKRFYLKNYASIETEKSIDEVIAHCTNWLAKQDIKKYLAPKKHWNAE
jgi:hypothetical protein